jgi:hypothetical protein
VFKPLKGASKGRNPRVLASQPGGVDKSNFKGTGNAPELLIYDLKIPYQLTQPPPWHGFPHPLEATVIIIIIIMVVVIITRSSGKN